MITIILAIAAITAFTLFGSYYARRYGSADGLIALFVIFSAMSNIMASKIAVFDFVIFQVFAPAAVIVFAVTFLITDLVNEKFGRLAVHKMIFLALVTQVAMTVFLFIGGLLPAAPFWTGTDAWNSLFGMVPRIVFAGWLAFLVSENLDAYLFQWIHKLTGGAHLWARNVFSTIPSLSVYTVIFVTLAFAGTGMPLWSLMVGQFATKYAVAIIDIPFMYLNRWMLFSKKH